MGSYGLSIVGANINPLLHYRDIGLLQYADYGDGTERPIFRIENGDSAEISGIVELDHTIEVLTIDIHMDFSRCTFICANLKSSRTFLSNRLCIYGAEVTIRKLKDFQVLVIFFKFMVVYTGP